MQYRLEQSARRRRLILTALVQVAVEITVDKNGEVTDARVKSGDLLLRKAALDAAKEFRFSNTLRRTVVATLTFNFVLGDKDKPAPKKPV